MCCDRVQLLAQAIVFNLINVLRHESSGAINSAKRVI